MFMVKAAIRSSGWQSLVCPWAAEIVLFGALNGNPTFWHTNLAITTKLLVLSKAYFTTEATEFTEVFETTYPRLILRALRALQRALRAGGNKLLRKTYWIKTYRAFFWRVLLRQNHMGPSMVATERNPPETGT